MPGWLLSVISWVLLALAATTFFWFVETLLKALMKEKPKRSLPFASESEGEGRAARRDIDFVMSREESTGLSRLNAKILKSGWIGGLLERVYFGLGQKKEMEPPRFLLKMEKSAAIAACFTVAFIVLMKISFNPGLVALVACVGFFLPVYQARNAAALRHKRVLLNLPSFVDLLALTIESGLDYLNSMDRILATSFKKKGPLEEEVENVLKEVQLGYPRRDALRHFAKRVDVQEIRSLVGLLIQSDELGTGLVQLLRNFSQDMRNRRTGRAEELAGKASTKMLGPLMIFIFPVIFALILLPFGYSMMKGGGGLPF